MDACTEVKPPVHSRREGMGLGLHCSVRSRSPEADRRTVCAGKPKFAPVAGAAWRQPSEE